MLNFVVGGKEYTLEYSFAAAEHKETVQKMFNFVSGVSYMRRLAMGSLLDASLSSHGDNASDIASIAKTAFYSGLLENHKAITVDEAYDLQKQYMKENKISYKKLFDNIKNCMEDDGFFELSGLTEMLEEMGENFQKAMAEAIANAKKQNAKTPQDHKKKSTSTKK